MPSKSKTSTERRPRPEMPVLDLTAPIPEACKVVDKHFRALRKWYRAGRSSSIEKSELQKAMEDMFELATFLTQIMFRIASAAEVQEQLTSMKKTLQNVGSVLEQMKGRQAALKDDDITQADIDNTLRDWNTEHTRSHTRTPPRTPATKPQGILKPANRVKFSPSLQEDRHAHAGGAYNSPHRPSSTVKPPTPTQGKRSTRPVQSEFTLTPGSRYTPIPVSPSPEREIKKEPENQPPPRVTALFNAQTQRLNDNRPGFKTYGPEDFLPRRPPVSAASRPRDNWRNRNPEPPKQKFSTVGPRAHV